MSVAITIAATACSWTTARNVFVHSKWFRAAVLPLDAGLCAALFPPSSVRRRHCRECGRPFAPPRHNTLYCSTCAAERVKRSKRTWARKNRADV